MRRISLLAVPCLLAACQKADEGFEPMMTPLEGADIPVRVELGEAVGHGSVAVPVRVVNAHGVAVPGGTVDLVVEGEGLSAPSSVTLDYSGHGELLVTGSLPQRFTVRATASSDGASLGDPVTCTLTGGPMPAWGLAPAWPVDAPPEQLLATRDGLLMAEGERLLWQPARADAPAREVARLSAPIEGFRGVQLDADGLTDVVVWTETQALALRGRNGGGLGWGAGFEAVSGRVVDAGAGPLDGDALDDLVLAWSDGDDGGLQAFSGDGLWGFTALVPWRLAEDTWSIGAGDFNGDGVHAVAVISEGTGDGVVRRMGLIDGEWLGVGQEVDGGDLSASLRDGARVAGAADITGDGVDELVFAQRREGDANLSAYMLRFDEGVRVYDFRYAGLGVSLAEVSGDGVADILFSELDPGDLRLVTIDSDDGGLFNRTLVTDFPALAVAAGDLGDDTFADLALSREGRVELRPGDLGAETGLWRVAEDGLATLLLGSVAPGAGGDFNGDGVAELLVLREAGAELYLQRYLGAWTPEGGLTVDTGRVDREALGAAGRAVLDLVLCGHRAYVLHGATDPTLSGVDLAGDALDLDFSVGVDGATALACAPDGVAALAGDEVLQLDLDGRAVDTLTAPSGSQRVALASAAGELTVVGCQEEGCEVLAWDADGDGQDEWVIARPDGATLHQGDEAIDLTLTGVPSAFDADGDGYVDLVMARDNELTLVRALSNGFAPAALLRGRTPLLGAASPVDLDGDGLPELVLPGEDGRLLVSLPQVAEAEPE